MDSSELTCEVRNRIALLTINRPERLNAWTPALEQQFKSRIEELQTEYPELAAIPICQIEERQQADVADGYDYWYVPSLFIGNEKLHEGIPTKQKLEKALRAAL